MINEKELLIANTSYTKKDFYQIYPEILDIVQKITERWDPAASNESDPGVVLLKLLAFIADKNNYNIDKNILEAFMPSATQESSMRKLTEMMGYNMRYYTSATTKVSFMYQGDLIGNINTDTGELIDAIVLKAFDTSVKDINDSINYVLLEDVVISKKYEEKTVAAIEGSLNYCNVGNSNIIKIVNLDDSRRFYLPETMIAENGIFVKNTGTSWADRWLKVDNLNTQINETKVWKFGVDSNKRLPYIEFSEDINKLIEDGLEIAYIITTGANGNVKAKVLVELADNKDSNGVSLVDDNNISTIVVENSSATSNGTDNETLDEAYNNFKRTIGTFDTLITCRDYANKIYQLVKESDNTTPLVSNIQVSDIRDDINRRETIMTYGDYGLEFRDVPHQEDDESLINHFDLYLYPFGAIVGAYNLESYKNSFKPDYGNLAEIKYELDRYKTIAHKLNIPSSNDIYCLKNMYELKARITTTYKVNTLEEAQILNNIYTALYKKFNMRNIDFGEEIPFDNILECIQNADTRIKNVSLEEPNITTKYMKSDGANLDLLTNRKTYIELVAKNVLAGRVPLFNYDDRFEYNYGDIKFDVNGISHDEVYGYDEDDIGKPTITKIKTELNIDSETELPYTLKANEIIQMIAPNFRTTITYPAYINYHFKSGTSNIPAVACVATEAVGNYAPTNQGDLISGYPINGIFYPYYIRTTTSKPIGKLVGTDGTNNYLYKLAASTIYSDTTTYYLILEGVADYSDTIGADEIIAGVLENQEYKLDTNDILYINYTDSSDNIYNIKYTNNEIITNGIVKEVDYVIIKPNFEIKDSTSLNAGGKPWAKTTGFSWGIEELGGMFSVGTNQQIDIRDYVKIELNEPTWCYWLIKDGSIPFNNNEYILQDNEYFFYTNEAKTELVILGSGTKLINNNVDPINFTIDYTKTKLDIDEVSSGGLAAFANDPWKLVQFRTNNSLLIQEMQFITLAEGDILNSASIEPESGDNEVITNKFKPIVSATYIIDDKQSSLPELITTGDTWEIHSRLDLNVGPKLSQKIEYNQKITLYSDSTPIVILEPVQTNSNDYEYPYIKSNILLQIAGGDNIIAPKTIDTETLDEINNLNIMVFNYKVPVYDYNSETGVSLVSNETDIYTKIGLKTSNNIKFNMLVPSSNSFGLLMIYYNKPENLVGIGATLSTENNENFLKLYNDDMNLTNTLELEQGINIIKISESSKLQITRENDEEGILIIGNPSIIKNPKIDSGSGDVYLEGVNYSLLGLESLGIINTSEGDILETEYLLKHIKTKATIENKDIFYYNCPIDNSLLIDYDDMSSPLVWYDYNNICNKFVISELDADKFEKGIVLTKSSRL